MKSRLARAGLIAVEVLGVSVAALVALAAFVLWRAQSGPVSLRPIGPMVSAFANSNLGGRVSITHIGGITLTRADAGAYRVILENVELGERGADAAGVLPLVDLMFTPADLLSGKPGPRRVLVDGAELRVTRRADSKLDVDLGDAGGDRVRAFQLLTGGKYFREAFEAAELRNAKITFRDGASGRSWSGSNGNGLVRRTAYGYEVRVNGAFEINAQISDLTLSADYRLDTEILSADLTLDQAPVGDLITMLFNRRTNFLTSPVSGRAEIKISKDGEVISSHIAGRAGEGALSIGSFTTKVALIETDAAFDPASKTFDVQKLAWTADAGQGELSGLVKLSVADETNAVDGVSFELAGDALNLSPPGFFENDLLIDRLVVDGAYDIASRRLALASVSAATSGLDISGALNLTGPERGQNKSPGVDVQLFADGAADVPTLLHIWPTTVAQAARTFVETRIPSGMFSDVEFTMALPVGGLVDGRMADEAMRLSFKADNATVIYAPGMTPLTGIAGQGELRGNSFAFDARRGAIGAVELSRGEVSIPVIAPKGLPAYYRFSAKGDAGEIMSVLAQEPLAVLKDSGLKASQFSGKASVKAELIRPNLSVAPRDAYKYSGTATFSDLSVDGLFGDASVTSGEGALKLFTESVSVTGNATVGATPVQIEWRQRFYGDGDKTEIKMSGVADSATGDFLGIPSRQLVQGQVPFEMNASGNLGAFRRVTAHADFTAATLTSAQFGWIKPAGSPATGEGRVRFVEDGVEVQSVKIDGDAINIDGAAKLDTDGRLLTAEFPAFRLEGAADLALSAVRQPGGRLSMTVVGDYLNGASFAEGVLDMGGAGAAPSQQDVDAAVTARIERVDMRSGVPFTDASFDFRRKGDMIEAFAFSAMGPNHKPVSLNLKPTGEDSGREQSVVARSDDIGSLLAGIFGIGSVRDGEGVLEFVFTPGDEGASGPVGTFQARNLRIVRAPLLAKVFAAGSLTGLADLMNGQGIEIADAYSKFSVVDGVVDLEVARATGPSVGMTAQGRFGLSGERDVDLDGAVAPAYGVNSLLGKTPIIGDLFVNREGEGLLALSYQVSGPASEPRVSVNPLSALTPGVFRRMFEEVRPDLAPAGDDPDDATPPNSETSNPTTPEQETPDPAAPAFTVEQPPPVEQ